MLALFLAFVVTVAFASWMLTPQGSIGLTSCLIAIGGPGFVLAWALTAWADPGADDARALLWGPLAAFAGFSLGVGWARHATDKAAE